MRAIAVVAWVALAAGCGHSSPPLEDAPRAPDAAVLDAASIDAPITMPDAADVAQLPGSDVATGAARMTSATYTFDVVVGPTQPPGAASGPTYTLTDNAAIRP